ncbi:S8 family peptidase [Sulfurimonas sp.]|uniref:S8 family peptidase n=1 Tax=Sulfurimonas sp. TaxID=2022749 RepID=UPI0019E0FAB5|nr:S8 family peptidase [Sulfurimonas sp.]MBE0515289.1 S8 family peptidase [Sulfurimonas sp.]
MIVENLKHLKIVKPPEEQPFTSTITGRTNTFIPERDRVAHSQHLQRKLNESFHNIFREESNYQITRDGMYLEFKSDPGSELSIKSLENIGSNIRLLNVREKKDQVLNSETNQYEDKTTTYATVYIPKINSNYFLDRVQQYATESTRTNKPKNAPLINSIADIQKALLIDSFWTDELDLIPGEEPTWCEVWLRDTSDEVIENFEALLSEHEIIASNNTIRFPERAVKIVNVNLTQLEKLSIFSDDIAEYRLAKESATFWTDMQNIEQSEWVNDLQARLEKNTDSNVAICILDNGVNNGHPLLSPILDNNDCLTVNYSWGTHDHHPVGHGTSMAGIAAYGSLEKCLSHKSTVELTHYLESVKICPPGTVGTAKELWGDITNQAISRAEINAPHRKRIVCMAVTAKDTRDRGRPSSWSASIDSITSGAHNEDNTKRLFIVSAGNCYDFNHTSRYPSSQTTDSIHDPAQSWNALTVGAYTSMNIITDPTLAGYVPVAPKDGLSPFTTTSYDWDNKWPIKPEIVMEGGNTACDGSGFSVECEDLALLSTNFQPTTAHFSHFNMTSLSTARASWFAAKIQAQYPEFWPETIRALMIHSAKWTNQLISQFGINMSSKSDIRSLLRICGYGVPSLQRALYSASNSLTLISEAYIQPFFKDDGRYKTKDMHLYDLPWPKEDLLYLEDDTEVEMRVTLSYFIEPGAGEIGWKNKYRYASHMLRFELNSPGELKDEFTRRINTAARNEENGHPGTESTSNHWVIGSNNRNKGSIHSDIWKGTAAELADSNLIAVYPGIGWWKERNHLHKWNSNTRYSLIVSISTTSTEVDLYTPVETQIKVATAIEV